MPKLTFGATCGQSPALAAFQDQIVVCWPGGGGLGGAQPNFQLNVMPVFPYESDTKLEGLQVLDEFSTHRPGLAAHNGRLWLAWTGNDPLGLVNVASLPALGANLEDKITFDGTGGRSGATSCSGPALMSHDGRLILAFCGGGGLGGGRPNGKINIAWSDDGRSWQMPGVVLEHQTSWHAPAVAPYVAGSGPNAQVKLAWTGTDDHIYLHDAYERRFDQLDDIQHGQTSPPEASFAGPAMATPPTSQAIGR